MNRTKPCQSNISQQNLNYILNTIMQKKKHCKSMQKKKSNLFWFWG